MTSASQRIALGGAALLAVLVGAGCATSTDDLNIDAAFFGSGDSGHTRDGASDSGVVTITGDSGFPSLDAGRSADMGTAHDGSMATDATTSDATTTPDSPTTGDSPASTDTGTGDTGTPDTGTPDTGHDTGTGNCQVVTIPGPTMTTSCPPPDTSGDCAPAGTSGFSPMTPTPATMPGACTSTQIQKIYNDCFSATGSASRCNADSTGATGTCFACIQGNNSDPTATQWGPILNTNLSIGTINFGGCVQLLEPCNSACAATFWNALQCEQAECGPNCPVTGQSSDDDFNACIDTADTCKPGGCATYFGGTSCSDSLTGSGHPASACFPSNSDPNYFEDAFLAVVPVFCQ